MKSLEERKAARAARMHQETEQRVQSDEAIRSLQDTARDRADTSADEAAAGDVKTTAKKPKTPKNPFALKASPVVDDKKTKK